MERFEQLRPEYLVMRSHNLRWLAELAALASIGIGTAVFLGWLFRPVWLETALPSLFAMAVNAAIGFGFAGGALLALVRGRRAAAGVLALMPLVVGLVSLLQTFGVAVSIDTALGHGMAAAGEHGGRISPNTAALLVVLGLVLGAVALAADRVSRSVAVRLASCAVAVVSLHAMAGHVAGSAVAIGWGSSEQMSLLAALCGLTLGVGLLANGWEQETITISRLPFWVPVAWCVAVLMIDLSTPLHYNIGVCYVPLVVCALWFQRASVAVIFAALATMLIVLGLFTAPPGDIPFTAAAVNRGLAAGAVWVMAVLVYLRHLAKRGMRHSAHHFAAAQRIASIGSFELYFSDMRLRGSDAFDVMHGLSGPDAHDWENFLRHLIPPDERAGFEAMLAAARHGVRPAQLSYTFLLPGGRVRNAVMHCDVLRGSTGEPRGIIGVVHDVTALQLEEARQADIQLQLRHAQKLEALGMLSSGIAHDLNNTLVPITTLVPLLQERASTADGQILEIVVDSARRAKALVRDMLAYSRKDEPAPEPIRLDAMIGEALRLLRAGVPRNVILVDRLEAVPEMLGNRGQLYQILLNLATNAAQAIGDRPGTITIGTACDADGAHQPADIRVYVEDDGDGMDAETARRVFEPYFSTKGPRSGTGLGLSIVSGIVKKHGGTILVRSTPGSGTRFDLLFPAILAIAPAVAA